MFAAVCTVALVVFRAEPGPPPRLKDDPSQPRLIVKEKGYFVHALPGSLDRRRGFPAPGLTEAASRGVTVLHTTIATGEMKVLAMSTRTVVPLVRNSPPPVSVSYVCGVAADRERLFVLQWSSPDYPSGGAYHLYVFRPDDGALIDTLEVKGEGLENETADRGPLRLTDNGVTCFGTRFEFKGTKVLKPSPEKKP